VIFNYLTLNDYRVSVRSQHGGLVSRPINYLPHELQIGRGRLVFQAILN
jgi:hypothetical protein